MIVYHADTLQQLHDGQILTLRPARTPIRHLYPKGVSSYGERAFLKPENQEQATMQAIDIMFDYVRCLYFPDKPSRFTSVFASASLEDSRAWLERIVQDSDTGIDDLNAPSNHNIFAVEPSRIYIADARFLDCENVLQGNPPALSNILPFALAYWDSVQEIHTELSDSMRRSYQKPELLLVPPVRVLRQIEP